MPSRSQTVYESELVYSHLVPPPVGSLPLVAYSRVSTAAQAASGIGMDAQHHTIDKLKAQGLAIAGWFEDAGRSGASMTRRPGLRAALIEIERGRAGGLIVAKIDRLGRSSADVCGLVERANREGWRLIALDAGLDTTTPAGEMVAAALAMAARFEWRRISERQVDKHQDLRRKGKPRGPTAVAVDVADRIIAMKANGLSLRAIGAQLEDEGVPTARGGAHWYAGTVRSAAETRRRELAAQADD